MRVQDLVRRLVPLASTVNADLQTALAKRLQWSKAGVFPGEKVDVLTHDRLPQLGQDRYVVSPKTDGQNFLLAGFADKKRGISLYLVDGHCTFYPLGRSASGQTVKSFVLNGELAIDRCTDSPVLQVFDVLLVRNVPTRGQAFFARLRRFFELHAFLMQTMPAMTPALIVTLKPFYALSSLDHVLALATYPFETDGLIFASTGTAAASLKWKPADRITVDFRVGDCTSELFVQGTDTPVGTLDAASQTTVRIGQIIECARVVHVDEDDDPLEWTWTLVRPRPDKTDPNATHVWRRCAQLLAKNVTIEDIAEAIRDPCPREHFTGTCTAAPKKRARSRSPKPCSRRDTVAQDTATSTKVDARTYFSKGAVSRGSSRSVAMKTFHNTVVKDALYAKYLANARTLLELGVGRGADVGRIASHGRLLAHVTAVDVDADALRECETRWAKGKHAVALRTLHLNLADKDATARAFPSKFDCVVCHFAVHYFADNAAAVLRATVDPGGYAIVTLFQKAFVDALVPHIGQVVEWQMGGVVQTRIRRTRADFVGVFVDTIGAEHEERLVDLGELCRALPEFRVIEQGRAFTAFAPPAHKAYGPDHPMWSFTALYCVLVLQRRDDTDRAPLTPPRDWTRARSPGQSMGQPSRPTLSSSPDIRPYSPPYSARSSSPDIRPYSPPYDNSACHDASRRAAWGPTTFD
jgi:SAM-dependent methyltransferase